MAEDAPDTNQRPPRRLARRLGALLWPYRWQVAGALALTLAVAFLGPLRPRLVQIAVDDHITTGDLPGLFRVVALIGLVLLGEGVASFALTYLTQWVGQHALYDLRTRVFRFVERQRLAFFDKTPIGTLITRATSDIEALADLLSAGAVTMIGDLGRLLFIGYFMLSLNLELGLVALLALPPMVLATEVFRRKMRRAYRETRKQVGRLNAFLQEHVSGMSVVQIFGREGEEQRRFEDVNAAHRDAHVQTVYYYALFYPVVDLIASVALGLVVWFGGTEAMREAVTVGTLIAFVQYVRMFFEPVRNLSDQLNSIQAAFAASERVFDLLDDDQSLAAPPRPAHFDGGRARGRIAFEDVWFAYERLPEAERDGEGSGIERDGQTRGGAAGGEDSAHPSSSPHPPSLPDWNWVLRGVSFVAEPGETLALVGATGSGKSTILSLLLRFYEPQRGRVTIDGIDVKDLPLDELRRQVGLVLQDVFLFSGSIEENVTLGADVPRERVVGAAELVGADRFIDRLPDGYASDVGERGGTLSLGQRQLLSFVRTLLYDPAVLVLDEATSSVDTETEEAVQRAVDVLMDGRTALVVAHRLSTVQDAQTILVLHKGEVRERGSHQALLAQGGLYRRLYELQYADQERAAA
ncbi:ABC transporter ATP-binding protein [Rubrivirga sp. S365]|uniref:ABC transporter ATP-binding protein n=1 Tax=Rubrivirga litoralis TaxID=3075598 RepID=A0ABU3BN12_9BACT|nr:MULTISPECIES: ABC transporter ATP-binding protein [unclassified Rubrivirga]MDT0630679.1 ABC transporter ATP-binding protein [Rubrivirga sp. F394]MDT7856252.1 ABC transporter ATP-binding protein [Rubrivirga sp. S365]